MTEQERQIYVAKQINRAVQLTIQSADLDDAAAMEIADIYPEWVGGKAYKVDEIVKYGVNADNETQLYKVIQAHTSQDDWTPDKAVSLFKAIGIADDGIPVWTQPYGAEDAYRVGDKVHYPDKDGAIYECIVDYMTHSPEAYPQGWREVK